MYTEEEDTASPSLTPKEIMATSRKTLKFFFFFGGGGGGGAD